jgi:hypothetical protein
MAFQETKNHSYAHGMIRVPDDHSFGGSPSPTSFRTVVRQPDLQTGERRQSSGWQAFRMPVIRDAVPADAERIGEAHAEAWRLA